LTKKLGNRLFEAFNKSSNGEDYDKEYHHSKEFDDEHKTKKDSSISSMSVGKI